MKILSPNEILKQTIKVLFYIRRIQFPWNRSFTFFAKIIILYNHTNFKLKFQRCFSTSSVEITLKTKAFHRTKYSSVILPPAREHFQRKPIKKERSQLITIYFQSSCILIRPAHSFAWTSRRKLQLANHGKAKVPSALSSRSVSVPKNSRDRSFFPRFACWPFYILTFPNDLAINLIKQTTDAFQINSPATAVHEVSKHRQISAECTAPSHSVEIIAKLAPISHLKYVETNKSHWAHIMFARPLKSCAFQIIFIMTSWVLYGCNIFTNCDV